MEPLVGDMVHVPSETYLFSEEVHRENSKYEKLSEPQLVLVIGEGCRFYQVLMLGNPWWVRKRDVYTIQEEATYDRQAS